MSFSSLLRLAERSLLKSRWALLAVLLAGVGGWLARERPAPQPEPAPSTSPPVSVAAIRKPAQSMPAPPAAPAGDKDADLLRRMRDDWCGFGEAESERQREAVYEKARAAAGTIGMEALEELARTPASLLLKATQAEVRQRWAQALTQRGDERSLAVADYLYSDESAAARVRLQGRARTSTDPLITALALQRPCARGTCTNVEAAQWSRLEPANLNAWLALTDTQASYAMDRLAAEARYSTSYQREVYAVLASLPQAQVPGLRGEAEIALMGALIHGWPLPSFRPLMAQCRGSLTDEAGVERCDAAAKLLWQHDDLLHRTLSLAIARSLIAAQPWRREVWAARAVQLEAAREWSSGEAGRVFGSLPELSTGCGAQAPLRRLLNERMVRGEWEHQRRGMQEAGVDEAGLAARWREQQGRSLLDPPRTTRPASAPARAG